jgi:hypothetical protein
MIVANFVTAKTKAGLVNAIRSMQLKESKFSVTIINIVKDGSDWVCWYYSDKSGVALNLKD